MLRLLAAGILAAAASVQLASTTVTYRDQGGRFQFSYPATFGSVMVGTNNGFGDRIAALRFDSFPARYGGEVVLTRGFPLIDLQAAGGLYDSLTLEIFPDPLRARVVAQLPRLTAENFCTALTQSRHIDASVPAFASLTPQERDAIGRTDVMRNANPRIIECRRSGDLVTFDKERAFEPGYPLQHVYGSVRFLTGTYSAFQLIAGGDAPPQSVRKTVEDLVRSFQPF